MKCGRYRNVDRVSYYTTRYCRVYKEAIDE